jgi:hypothetical protein
MILSKAWSQTWIGIITGKAMSMQKSKTSSKEPLWNRRNKSGFDFEGAWAQHRKVGARPPPRSPGSPFPNLDRAGLGVLHHPQLPSQRNDIQFRLCSSATALIYDRFQNEWFFNFLSCEHYYSDSFFIAQLCSQMVSSKSVYIHIK